MTRQEIITELQNLPPLDWKSVKDQVDKSQNGRRRVDPVSEQEVLRLLYEEGTIGNLPDPSKYAEYDNELELIQVLGEPVSETIIKERG